MNAISTLLNSGREALIGRDPIAVVEEYAHTTSPEDDRLTEIEHKAMERLLSDRSEGMPSTTGRRIAVEILPGAAMVCSSIEQVDAMIAAAMGWIHAMGDVRGYARMIDAMRENGDPCAEAAMKLWPALETELVLDVHDATRLTATLFVTGREGAIVGIHEIDRDQRDGAADPRPELAA